MAYQVGKEVRKSFFLESLNPTSTDPSAQASRKGHPFGMGPKSNTDKGNESLKGNKINAAS